MTLATSHTFAQHVPTFEEVISLRNIVGAVISPNGKHIAYTLQSVDWNDNRNDIEIWLSKDLKKPFQLTFSKHSNSTNPVFSPDGQWIAFLSDRGTRTQIYVLRIDGGEAFQATKEDEGVTAFDWHPSGNSFILIKPEKEDRDKKAREKRYGSFEADDKEYTLSHLWQVDFKPEGLDPSERPCYESTDSAKIKAGCVEWPKAKRLTEGKFTVTRFYISPDGTKVAFNHQPDPLINSFIKSDISVITL